MQDRAPRTEPRPNLVLIDVRAYNKTTGAYISDLSKEDFEITDNGALQEITDFDFRTAPLDLALVMDVSGSMMDIPRHVALGAAAALEFLGTDDRVAVLSFSLGCRVEVEFTRDRDRIVDAIETAARRAKPGLESQTRLYDALARALQLFEPRGGSNPRRAIVAVTDDREQGSKATTQMLSKTACEKDVTVNALFLREEPPFRRGPPKRWPPSPEPPRPPILFPHPRVSLGSMSLSMERLVEATGGEYLRGQTKRDALIEIFDRVRARYLVGYILPEPQRVSGVHQIRAELSERGRTAYPDAALRARSEYFCVTN